jgi:hypothetical protein
MFGVLPLLPHTLAGCRTWLQEQSYLCNLPYKWCYNVSYWWDIYPFFSRCPLLSKSLKHTAMFV